MNSVDSNPSRLVSNQGFNCPHCREEVCGYAVLANGHKLLAVRYDHLDNKCFKTGLPWKYPKQDVS